MSKRVFHHPPELATGRKYWRSVGQLADTPEFRSWLETEFPRGASELNGSDVSRRSFLQLMGASAALAGLSLAGCRRPEKHLVPFTRGVEWGIPGKALFFATSRPCRNGYAPLIATTYDGRPTKVEGNPLHQASNGATDVFAQASLLDLYDPDRARHFTNRGKNVTSAEFEKSLDQMIATAADGAGLAFLLERNPSPTRERLRTEIERKFPAALWVVYEPLEGADWQAPAASFGGGLQALPQFAKADRIMALDADFLGNEGTISGMRAFAARRKAEGDNVMNRLYAVENRFTVTGGMADHRLRVPASQIGAFALALGAEVSTQTGDASLGALLASAPKSEARFNADWIREAAADLAAHKGRSLVLVGPRQPLAVHALVQAINAALGNLGETVVGRRGQEKAGATLSELSKQIDDGKVTTLIAIGGNAAYNAPVDLEFHAKLKKVREIVRVSSHVDETSQFATWQVPGAHYLETWGDGLAEDGSYLSVQPMILPLFGGWSELDVLAKFAGLPKPPGPELVQETFRQIAAPSDFQGAWAKFLHDGFLAESAAPTEPMVLNGEAARVLLTDNLSLPSFDAETLEVVLVSDSKLEDGRHANNGWLQEFPDPITKLTWDNAALISPATAKKLKLEQGAMVEITVENRKLQIPVLIAPGHADQSLTIPLGYGRTHAGRVGTVGQTTEGEVFDGDMRSGGFNGFALSTVSAPYFAVGAQVKALGSSYKLAITQEHGSLEGRGPDLLREGTVEQYKAEPDFAKAMGIDAHAHWTKVNGKKTEIVTNSLYSHPPLDDIHQWGMTIDLNACTGCGACMVACQAENNIPVVGKRQVLDGREMHWIRADRYFASSDDKDVTDPEMVSQPMLCQHCENAPCETVCPVNATVHSKDGLNVMAYNRCIGTRYCANNCPFKVRRFNFFDYNERKLDKLRTWNLVNEKGMEETVKMSRNPNVTVRMRGVMEKCTFCVQRIQEAKIATKVKVRDSGDVKIPADAFTTACAQVCPTEAIVFGDIANSESSVYKLRAMERGYRLLEYLNVDTRVWYLARIRNPNSKMPDAAKIAAYSRGHHHPPSGHPSTAEPGGVH